MDYSTPFFVLFNLNTQVTYKWLSRKLDVPVNAAKRYDIIITILIYLQLYSLGEGAGPVAPTSSCMQTGALVVSSQTPPSARERPKGVVTFEHFLGSCKLSILVFTQANRIAALRFSCDIASCTRSAGCLGLAVACSRSECSSMILTCNRRVINCISLRLSYAPVQPRNHFNVTRPFPTWGLGDGNQCSQTRGRSEGLLKLVSLQSEALQRSRRCPLTRPVVQG